MSLIKVQKCELIINNYRAIITASHNDASQNIPINHIAIKTYFFVEKFPQFRQQVIGGCGDRMSKGQSSNDANYWSVIRLKSLNYDNYLDVWSTERFQFVLT